MYTGLRDRPSTLDVALKFLLVEELAPYLFVELGSRAGTQDIRSIWLRGINDIPSCTDNDLRCTESWYR